MSRIVRAAQPEMVERAEAFGPIFQSQRTLSDVVAWMASMGEKDSLVDVVAQDEYTHDVVVRWGAVFLVYDVT